MNRAIRMLCLDPGTLTGYAVTVLEGRPGKVSIGLLKSGTLDLGSNRKLKHPRSRKLHVLEREMSSLMRQYRPTLVGYEVPFVRGEHATRLLFGAAGVIEMVSEAFGAAVVSARPPTIKKALTGDGRADKDKMIEFAARRFGLDAHDLTEHAADALAASVYFADNLVATSWPLNVKGTA